MKENQSKSSTKSVLARVFNVREWSDWNRVRAGGKSIEGAAKDLFVLKTTQVVETFDEAQRRMKLTDENLAERARALFNWSVLMLFFSVLLLVYALYHFVYGSFHAGILVLALVCLAISLSFRYSFWYFQIKNRKLGCSFQEWFQYTFKGKKP